MRLTGDLQAVVMAGGKGSRMTDLTAGKAKCLLPVGGVPLLWYPLHLLQTNGFAEALVVVQDSAKAEVARIPERYGLTIRVEVVGIPGQEELGTADSLRRVGDRITGSDVLVVAGDLLLESGTLRGVTDIHRLNRSSVTMLLGGPGEEVMGVPGARSTKYKKERDLVGVSGDQVVVYTAEADVEEGVRVRPKVLAAHPRMVIHSNLQDCHLYIMKRWVIDYVIADKNISTIKGELVPLLVGKQFSSGKAVGGERQEVGAFLPPTNPWDSGSKWEAKSRYGVFASRAPPASLCLRVNTVPSYWAARSLVEEVLTSAGVPSTGPRSEVGERAQVQGLRLGEACTVANKTSLQHTTLGQGCRVEEKVRIANCVIMDNVTIASGSVLQDSIICDGSTVSGTVKGCIVGRGEAVEGAHEAQTLLARDRMMEV